MTKVKLRRMMTILQLNYPTKNQVLPNNRTLGVDDADEEEDDGLDLPSLKSEISGKNTAKRSLQLSKV